MLSLKVPFVLAFLFVLPSIGTDLQAMTVEQFGRMNDDDEATYVTLLVEASANTLKAQGQPEQATRTLAFFHETGRSGGAQELAAQLQAVFAVNKRNAINPNNRAPVLLVEDAMEMTLREQGIKVPAKVLLASGKDFRPVGPPRQHLGGP